MSLQTVDTSEPRLRTLSLFSAACATGLLAAFLFSAFPEIDLCALRLFYSEDGSFAFSRPSLGADIRFLLRVGFVLVCAGLARLMLRRESARWFFADGSPFHEHMLGTGRKITDALSHLICSIRNH